MTKVIVTIEYQELNNDDWKIFAISADEYFDFNYVDEDLSWESIPLYNNAFEYLPLDKKSIQATKLFINDEINKVTRRVFESLWNSGNNRLIEVVDEGFTVNRHEIILSILFSEDSEVTQIFRCYKVDGIFKPILMSLITKTNDGTEIEKRLL